MVTLEEALAQRDELQVLFDHTFDRAKEIAAERDAARKVATDVYEQLARDTQRSQNEIINLRTDLAKSRAVIEDLNMMLGRLARFVKPHNALLCRDAVALLRRHGLPDPWSD